MFECPVPATLQGLWCGSLRYWSDIRPLYGRKAWERTAPQDRETLLPPPCRHNAARTSAVAMPVYRQRQAGAARLPRGSLNPAQPDRDCAKSCMSAPRPDDLPAKQPTIDQIPPSAAVPPNPFAGVSASRQPLPPSRSAMLFFYRDQLSLSRSVPLTGRRRCLVFRVALKTFEGELFFTR